MVVCNIVFAETLTNWWRTWSVQRESSWNSHYMYLHNQTIPDRRWGTTKCRSNWSNIWELFLCWKAVCCCDNFVVQLLHIAFEPNNKLDGVIKCHRPAGKCCTFTGCIPSFEQKILALHVVHTMVSFYTKDKTVQDCLSTCKTKHMICKSFMPVFFGRNPCMKFVLQRVMIGKMVMIYFQRSNSTWLEIGGSSVLAAALK